MIGEYQHNLDAKGRVTIPAKFREDLGDKFYVSLGFDSCLFLRSAESLQKLLEKLENAPVSETAGIQRYFFSRASEVEIDKQGRFVLPPKLREKAHLEKDLTIIGAIDRVEIWDTAAWEEYCDKQTNEDVLAAMKALGI